jgi:hypothetical protein
LDKTYREVARRLPDNQDVRFEKVKGKEELILTPLDALDEPPSLIQLRKVVAERLPRIDPQADYGELNVVSRHRLKLQRIAPHWDDMLGLGGSLLQGRVPATGIMRTLQVGENPTRLAQGIAEFGRIDKTLHSLRFIDDKDMRRGTLTQLNRGEGRHSVARVVFSGKRGELRQRYRDGQEDQLGALGLVVNMIVLWNTIYMEAVLEQFRKEGYPVNEEDKARLSPLIHEHINTQGRHSFVMPEAVVKGELRPLRNRPMIWTEAITDRGPCYNRKT